MTRNTIFIGQKLGARNMIFMRWRGGSTSEVSSRLNGIPLQTEYRYVAISISIASIGPPPPSMSHRPPVPESLCLRRRLRVDPSRSRASTSLTALRRWSIVRTTLTPRTPHMAMAGHISSTHFYRVCVVLRCVVVVLTNAATASRSREMGACVAGERPESWILADSLAR